MSTHEVQSAHWPAFFARFNELQQGRLVTVERSTGEGDCEQVAAEALLEGLEFNRDHACQDRLTVKVRGVHRKEIAQEMEPIHVKLREEGKDRKVLEVDSERGVFTVRFHSGRVEELMQGF